MPFLVLAAVGLVVFAIVQFRLIQYRRAAEQYDMAKLHEMEAASVIYDRNGEQYGRIFIQNRHPIPYEEIPERMIQALIAAEDNRFYTHKGVDYMGIIRAALANYRAGRITQGASTITQQLARNSFDLRERSYERKLVEMFLAERIEKAVSKEKILELYLNRVYFGGGLYGIESAARGYFGKPAKELDVAQCAMLAGILKSPNALSPWNNLKGAENARNFVLERMREMGFISRAELREAKETRLFVLKRTSPFRVSYAVDLVRQQAVAVLGYERAMNGGYRIYTTLDAELQRTAERALREQLSQIEKRPGYQHPTYEQYAAEFQKLREKTPAGLPVKDAPIPAYLQGAVIALENKTGGIVVLVGGRDFSHNEYNRALQARRPPGTAFTPFVFAAAYENGMYPGEIVQDAAIDNRLVMIGGTTGILGEWGVERADNEYEGGIPAHEALVRGKNAATLRLGMNVGLEKFFDFVKRAGIESPLREYNNAFLGSSEVTLEELVLAYTTFANGGMRPEKPYIIQKIVDAEGKVIYEAKPKLVQVTAPEIAWQVHSGLVDALIRGTGSVAYEEYDLRDFPAAGKTGTAYQFTEALFVGYTTALTCGVWTGFDRPRQIYRGAFGKDLALPVWVSIMNKAREDFPPEPFVRPAGLAKVEVSGVTGLLANSPASAAAAKSLGLKDDPSRNRVEWITEEQRQNLEKKVVSVFDKQYDQEEWPRAASAVDLATIRPVAVSSPPLLGFHDVYKSVRPAGQAFDESEIPVMRALPVDGSDPEVEGKTPKTEEDGDVSGIASALPAATVRTLSEEVRRAEAVPASAAPVTEPQAIEIEAPEPLRF